MFVSGIQTQYLDDCIRTRASAASAEDAFMNSPLTGNAAPRFCAATWRDRTATSFGTCHRDRYGKANKSRCLRWSSWSTENPTGTRQTSAPLLGLTSEADVFST